MDKTKLLKTNCDSGVKCYDDPDANPGIISKSASLSPIEVTDGDLEKINKYTLSPVSADDIYAFKAMIADNEQDDRNYLPFDLKALQDLEGLYPGKTMLKDHNRKADNQVARVYDTFIQKGSSLTELGEEHAELFAKIYMIKTESNKDLIAEISGGIKKEVSTSTTPEKMICNICGTDNMVDWCKHWPGIEYDFTDSNGRTERKKCKLLLSGAKEAYELSFVAVPAQPRAGTQKCVGFMKPVKQPTESKEMAVENDVESVEEYLLKAKLEDAKLYNSLKTEVRDYE